MLNSDTFVGSVIVNTNGSGVESYVAPEEEWIRVQPGDRFSLLTFAGGIPYDKCSLSKFK